MCIFVIVDFFILCCSEIQDMEDIVYFFFCIFEIVYSIQDRENNVYFAGVNYFLDVPGIGQRKLYFFFVFLRLCI